MNTLENYVEAMFNDFPKTKENLDVKANILASMEDKYDDLIANGKTEQVALGIVISQFGDISELKEAFGISSTDDVIEYLSTKRLSDYLSFARKQACAIALGVSMIILSVIGPILIGEEQEILGVTIFLVTVALSVGVFIIYGFRSNDYKGIKAGKYHLLESDKTIIQIEHTRFKPKYQFAIATGVIICILSSVVFIILGENGSESLGFVLFFGLIAIAVYLCIVFGMLKTMYNLLLRDEEFIQELQHELQRTRMFGWIYGITMPLATMIFLWMSWERWDELDSRPTWLIFPVVAILTHGLVEILNRVNKNN